MVHKIELNKAHARGVVKLGHKDKKPIIFSEAPYFQPHCLAENIENEMTKILEQLAANI